MSALLAGKTILVTRPVDQATVLQNKIAGYGGHAIAFPVIEIKEISQSRDILDQFEHMPDDSILIFISANAVHSTFKHYLKDRPLADTFTMMAVGAQTASLLNDYGIDNVIHPGTNGSSKALLDLPVLQSNSLRNRTVFIVRGEGGPDHLKNTMIARGVNVQYIQVYRRCLPNYSFESRRKIWHDGRRLDAIVVSSGEALRNLISLTVEEDVHLLLQTPLVVMSHNIQKLAESCGFLSHIESAEQRDDIGLMNALLKLLQVR